VAKLITVRRAPGSAYNPKRPVSDLLKAHIRNLEAITARTAPAGPRRKPKTEAQASAYIAELTRQVPNLSVPADPPAAGGAPAPDAALAFAALARRPRPSARKGGRRKPTAAAGQPARRTSRRTPRGKAGKKPGRAKRRRASRTSRRSTR
jgi:hypothetical protein